MVKIKDNMSLLTGIPLSHINKLSNNIEYLIADAVLNADLQGLTECTLDLGVGTLKLN